MSHGSKGGRGVEFTCAPYDDGHPMQVVGRFNRFGVEAWCPACGFSAPVMAEVLTGSARELADLLVEESRAEYALYCLANGVDP